MSDYTYIENCASLLAIIKLETKLLEAKLDGDIIPDQVFEIIKLEKENYGKEI